MSELSGRYRGRPSIARYIEESMAPTSTATSLAIVSLDVLSEHQAYLDDEGQVRGLFVVSARPAALGSPVALEVRLPWGEQLEVAGEVEWIVETPRSAIRQRPGFGVRLELVDHHRALLEAALALREPIRPPPEARRR